MIESDGEILVDYGAAGRFVLNLEMAVGEGQAVERLRRAGHGVDGAANESGKRGSASARRPAWQRDWGRAQIIRDRQRQSAVRCDAQAQVEPVEFKPAHPNIERGRRERIEAEFAAWRRKDRSAGKVAHRQALEPQTHPP